MMNVQKEEPIIERCNNCRYYKQFADDDEEEELEEDELEPEDITGYCRRYPPQVGIVYPSPVSALPEVSGQTGWCGEFTPKL